MNEPSASTIKRILEDPFAGSRQWTVQGLGMLRTYLDGDEVSRLHIWDPDTAQTYNEQGEIPSTVHDHPWDFTSRVYSGVMGNQRFDDQQHEGLRSAAYYTAGIRCGVGGGLLTVPEQVHLWMRPIELLIPGDQYAQAAPELHESQPAAGTVTVITRSFKTDRDIARVCWREGDWVTAEPRAATVEEVQHFTRLALSTWEAV